MFMRWPAPGRQGSESGVVLIGRISRLARLAGVSGASWVAPLWFLIPLCGAALMLLTAIDSVWSRRAGWGVAAVAFAELGVLFAVLGRLGLDLAAGLGFATALLGIGLHVAGSILRSLSRR